MAIAVSALAAQAQERVLTLEDCREMALKQSKELDQARIQTEMAGYDKKIALANYFPKVSATGAYVYNSRNIALVNEDQSDRIRNMGTNVQDKMWLAAQQKASPRARKSWNC